MSDPIHYPEADWYGCKRCGLHESRRRTVFRSDGRVRNRTVERDGRLIYYQGEPQEGTDEEILPYPLKVPKTKQLAPTFLFIGEAPDVSDNITGIPYSGEVGRVFNLCLSYCTTTFNFEITLLLACHPWRIGKWGAVVQRKPTSTEVEACKPRIKDLTTHVPYDGYIYLETASRTVNLKNTVNLKDPAAILKLEYKVYSMKEFALKLDNYVKSYYKDKGITTDR